MEILRAALFVVTILAHAYAEPGFYHITFPGFPETVKRAEVSVFEIRAVNPDTKIQVKATAFLMNDGKSLWTKLAPELRGFPLVLVNSKGTTQLLADFTISAFAQDLVCLNFKRELGTPLVAASRATKSGDEVFLLSYPAGTGPYASKTWNAQVYKSELHTRNPLADSKGDGIFISSGKILSNDGLLTSDTDTAFGSEGAPVFNSSGEVVGINAGGESQSFSTLGALSVTSRFVRVEELTK